MAEQFGAIGPAGLEGLSNTARAAAGRQTSAAGPDFKTLLMNSINEVNRLQADADQAMTNLATNKTDNVAEVFTAVKKAELAFQTLMQIRNKLESAYDEIKQMRV